MENDPASRPKGRRLVVRATILAGILLVVLAAVAPVALHLRGGLGVLTAAVAAAVCLIGADLALGISALFHGPRHVWGSLLGSMAARSGAPLIVGVGVHLYGGPLAEAGFLYYLLVFYLVALAVETYLSLPRG
jgi:hypothetical protein